MGRPFLGSWYLRLTSRHRSLHPSQSLTPSHLLAALHTTQVLGLDPYPHFSDITPILEPAAIERATSVRTTLEQSLYETVQRRIDLEFSRELECWHEGIGPSNGEGGDLMSIVVALGSIFPEARKLAKKQLQDFPLGSYTNSAEPTVEIKLPPGNAFVDRMSEKVAKLVAEGKIDETGRYFVLRSVVGAVERLLSERDHHVWMGVSDKVAKGAMGEGQVEIEERRDNLAGKTVGSFMRGEGTGVLKLDSLNLLPWADRMRRELGHENGAINVSPLLAPASLPGELMLIPLLSTTTHP